MKSGLFKRGPASNKYALELQGRHCGWLTDVAGMSASGELGGPGCGKYEELELRCWPGMPRPFYAWIERSFAEAPGAEDGEIVLADDGFHELSRLRWRSGVVAEFSVGACDIGQSEHARLTLKFSPQGSVRSYVGGELVGEALDTRWPAPPADPALHIDGLEEACSQLRRIEALSIRQRIERVRDDHGVRVLRSGAVTTSPLVLVLPEHKAHGFHRWQEACAAGRSNGRTATLALGSPAVGFTVVLQHVRPVRIVEAGEGEGRRRDLRVELRVGAVGFAFARARPDVV